MGTANLHGGPTGQLHPAQCEATMEQPTLDVAPVLLTETAGALATAKPLGETDPAVSCVSIPEEEADYAPFSPTSSVDDALGVCAEPLEQHADNCSVDRTTLGGDCGEPDLHDPAPLTAASTAPNHDVQIALAPTSPVPAPGGKRVERSKQALRKVVATLLRQFLCEHVPIVLHTCGEDDTNPRRRLENVLKIASVCRDSQDCINAGWLHRGGSWALWVSE